MTALMQLFHDFEAELDRQRYKLAESWSVAQGIEYRHFDARKYDVPRFQDMTGRINLNMLLGTHLDNLILTQNDLLKNVLFRMKQTADLVLAQAAYGIRVDAGRIVETTHSDLKAFDILRLRRESLRMGKFHPDAHEIDPAQVDMNLVGVYSELEGALERYHTGKLPRDLVAKSKGNLIATIFNRRADYASANMEHAEIYHARADHLITAAAGLKIHAAQNEGPRIPAQTHIGKILEEAKAMLGAVEVIHTSTQKFMSGLFEMYEEGKNGKMALTRYEPLSVYALAKRAP